MADIIIVLLRWCFPGLVTVPTPPSTPETRDLTQKVVKLKAYPSACGSLSDIYEGRLNLDNGQSILVAIKMLRPVGHGTCPLQRLRHKLMKEGILWSKLQHPNIAPFLGVCFDIDGSKSPCLISHFYKRGNVRQYLDENPSVDRLQLSAQILAGICYLHSHQLIHGDIKATNVMVDDEGQALIIDFGFSRTLEPTEQTLSSSLCGTQRWMAPELISPEPDNECTDEDETEVEKQQAMPKPTFAADVWASSMTVLEILTGKLPFYHLPHGSAVIAAVQRGKRPRACPKDITSEIWTVLQQCWRTQPEERPSAFALSTFLNVVSGLRRANMSPLSVDGAVDILKIVDRRADGGCVNQHRQPGQLAMPYECYWPWCGAMFHELLESHEHHMEHVLSV